MNDVVTVSAIASSIVLQFSVLPTAFGWLTGAALKEDSLPFVANALNSVVGLAFAIRAQLTASIITQTCGTAIFGGCVAILLLQSSAKARDNVMQQTGVAGLIVFVLGLLTLFFRAYARQLLGSASVVLSISASSSPLSSAGQVLAERDASRMVPAMILANFASCVLWTIWAVAVVGDPFTTVSCGVGAAVGVLQIALVAAFHPSSPCKAVPIDPEPKEKDE